jgi:outer membrane biosynthesis protein TonB
MKIRILIILILAVLPLAVFCQSADASFHAASNQYIHEKNREALSTVESALQRYPNDGKLKALRDKIKEEQKKQQQQQEQEKKEQEQQEKEQKEKEEQEKEQKEQQEKEQKEKEQQEKEEQQKKEQEKKQPQEEPEQKEQEKKEQPNLDQKKLEQMKISEEKARMILEAMKNQEKQYLQQNKRKATKSRDRSKPDW